ncbi:MAG: hypothetical protein WDM91_11145 [Rhizomicrobium sp.]
MSVHPLPERKTAPASTLTRIAVRMDKAAAVTMPDGGVIYAPLVRRPQLRNAMTTAEQILQEIAELAKRGPVVITELRIGDAPKPVAAFRPLPPRQDDGRPSDSAFNGEGCA